MLHAVLAFVDRPGKFDLNFYIFTLLNHSLTSCGEDKCKCDVMTLHICCLVEIRQVEQQPQKYYHFLPSQWGEYQSLRDKYTQKHHSSCRIKYLLLTETEIGDVNLRHFLSLTGNTTDKISKPMEAPSTRKFHQHTFVSLLATEKTMIWKKNACRNKK